MSPAKLKRSDTVFLSPLMCWLGSEKCGDKVGEFLGDELDCVVVQQVE